MKIIGHTSNGYLIEASAHEVTKLSGVSAGIVYGNHELRVGTEIKPHDAYDHIQRILQNEQSRKSIADQLRAAAVVIETTPRFVTLPDLPAEPAERRTEIPAESP